jgi:hypothetical protein
VGQFEIYPSKRSARSRTTVHSKKACWIPACAGMTIPADHLVESTIVTPAKASIQRRAMKRKSKLTHYPDWAPMASSFIS